MVLRSAVSTVAKRVALVTAAQVCKLIYSEQHYNGVDEMFLGGSADGG